jgi:Protein of unknown function (DUF3040)
MDDDPVLQELSAELERDDPALAALLSGPVAAGRHRGHGLAWTVLATTVVLFCALFAPAVTFGVVAMLLVLASPLLACWWCAGPGDGPTPRPT